MLYAIDLSKKLVELINERENDLEELDPHDENISAAIISLEWVKKQILNLED